MTHPLAIRLSPLIQQDVESLRYIVAQCVVEAETEEERARFRRFGAELGAVKRRIEARQVPPSREEIEIALTAVLALSGQLQAP